MKLYIVLVLWWAVLAMLEPLASAECRGVQSGDDLLQRSRRTHNIVDVFDIGKADFDPNIAIVFSTSILSSYRLCVDGLELPSTNLTHSNLLTTIEIQPWDNDSHVGAFFAATTDHFTDNRIAEANRAGERMFGKEFVSLEAQAGSGYTDLLTGLSYRYGKVAGLSAGVVFNAITITDPSLDKTRTVHKWNGNTLFLRTELPIIRSIAEIAMRLDSDTPDVFRIGLQDLDFGKSVSVPVYGRGRNEETAPTPSIRVEGLTNYYADEDVVTTSFRLTCFGMISASIEPSVSNTDIRVATVGVQRPRIVRIWTGGNGPGTSSWGDHYLGLSASASYFSSPYFRETTGEAFSSGASATFWWSWGKMQGDGIFRGLEFAGFWAVNRPETVSRLPPAHQHFEGGGFLRLRG